MRKALYALPVIAAAFATPALAQPYYDNAPYPPAAPVVAGAAVGTAAGLGFYNGWYGAAFTMPALTSAAVGGVAAVGTVAFVDALLQPCRGFHAMFDLSHGQCVNGQYVGYQPRPVAYREHRGRRVVR